MSTTHIYDGDAGAFEMILIYRTGNIKTLADLPSLLVLDRSNYEAHARRPMTEEELTYAEGVPVYGIHRIPTDQIMQDNRQNLMNMIEQSRRRALNAEKSQTAPFNEVKAPLSNVLSRSSELQEWWYGQSYSTLFEHDASNVTAFRCDRQGGVKAPKSIKVGEDVCKPIPLRSTILFSNGTRQMPRYATQSAMFAFVDRTVLLKELESSDAISRQTSNGESVSLWNMKSIYRAFTAIQTSWKKQFSAFGPDALANFRREYACTCEPSRCDILCCALEHSAVYMPLERDVFTALTRHAVEMRDQDTGEPLGIGFVNELIQHMLAPAYRIGHHPVNKQTPTPPALHPSSNASRNYVGAVVNSGRTEPSPPPPSPPSSTLLSMPEPNAAVYVHLESSKPYFSVVALRDIAEGENIVASLGRGLGPWRHQDRTLHFMNPATLNMIELNNARTTATGVINNLHRHLQSFIVPSQVATVKRVQASIAQDDRVNLRQLLPHVTDAILTLVRINGRFKRPQRLALLEDAKKLSTCANMLGIRNVDYVLWLHVLIQRLQTRSVYTNQKSGNVDGGSSGSGSGSEKSNI